MKFEHTDRRSASVPVLKALTETGGTRRRRPPLWHLLSVEILYAFWLILEQNNSAPSSHTEMKCPLILKQNGTRHKPQNVPPHLHEQKRGAGGGCTKLPKFASWIKPLVAGIPDCPGAVFIQQGSVGTNTSSDSSVAASCVFTHLQVHSSADLSRNWFINMTSPHLSPCLSSLSICTQTNM